MLEDTGSAKIYQILEDSSADFRTLDITGTDDRPARLSPVYERAEGQKAQNVVSYAVLEDGDALRYAVELDSDLPPAQRLAVQQSGPVTPVKLAENALLGASYQESIAETRGTNAPRGQLFAFDPAGGEDNPRVAVYVTPEYYQQAGEGVTQSVGDIKASVNQFLSETGEGSRYASALNQPDFSSRLPPVGELVNDGVIRIAPSVGDDFLPVPDTVRHLIVLSNTTEPPVPLVDDVTRGPTPAVQIVGLDTSQLAGQAANPQKVEFFKGLAKSAFDMEPKSALSPAFDTTAALQRIKTDLGLGRPEDVSLPVFQQIHDSAPDRIGFEVEYKTFRPLTHEGNVPQRGTALAETAGTRKNFPLLALTVDSPGKRTAVIELVGGPLNNQEYENGLHYKARQFMVEAMAVIPEGSQQRVSDIITDYNSKILDNFPVESRNDWLMSAKTLLINNEEISSGDFTVQNKGGRWRRGPQVNVAFEYGQLANPLSGIDRFLVTKEENFRFFRSAQQQANGLANQIIPDASDNLKALITQVLFERAMVAKLDDILQFSKAKVDGLIRLSTGDVIATILTQSELEALKAYVDQQDGPDGFWQVLQESLRTMSQDVYSDPDQLNIDGGYFKHINKEIFGKALDLRLENGQTVITVSNDWSKTIWYGETEIEPDTIDVTSRYAPIESDGKYYSVLEVRNPRNLSIALIDQSPEDAGLTGLLKLMQSNAPDLNDPVTARAWVDNTLISYSDSSEVRQAWLRGETAKVITDLNTDTRLLIETAFLDQATSVEQRIRTDTSGKTQERLLNKQIAVQKNLAEILLAAEIQQAAETLQAGTGDIAFEPDKLAALQRWVSSDVEFTATLINNDGIAETIRVELDSGLPGKNSHLPTADDSRFVLGIRNAQAYEAETSNYHRTNIDGATVQFGLGSANPDSDTPFTKVSVEIDIAQYSSLSGTSENYVQGDLNRVTTAFNQGETKGYSTLFNALGEQAGVDLSSGQNIVLHIDPTAELTKTTIKAGSDTNPAIRITLGTEGLDSVPDAQLDHALSKAYGAALLLSYDEIPTVIVDPVPSIIDPLALFNRISELVPNGSTNLIDSYNNLLQTMSPQEINTQFSQLRDVAAKVNAVAQEHSLVALPKLQSLYNLANEAERVGVGNCSEKCAVAVQQFVQEDVRGYAVVDLADTQEYDDGSLQVNHVFLIAGLSEEPEITGTSWDTYNIRANEGAYVVDPWTETSYSLDSPDWKANLLYTLRQSYDPDGTFADIVHSSSITSSAPLYVDPAGYNSDQSVGVSYSLASKQEALRYANGSWNSDFLSVYQSDFIDNGNLGFSVFQKRGAGTNLAFITDVGENMFVDQNISIMLKTLNRRDVAGDLIRSYSAGNDKLIISVGDSEHFYSSYTDSNGHVVDNVHHMVLPVSEFAGDGHLAAQRVVDFLADSLGEGTDTQAIINSYVSKNLHLRDDMLTTYDNNNRSPINLDTSNLWDADRFDTKAHAAGITDGDAGYQQIRATLLKLQDTSPMGVQAVANRLYDQIADFIETHRGSPLNGVLQEFDQNARQVMPDGLWEYGDRIDFNPTDNLNHPVVEPENIVHKVWNIDSATQEWLGGNIQFDQKFDLVPIPSGPPTFYQTWVADAPVALKILTGDQSSFEVALKWLETQPSEVRARAYNSIFDFTQNNPSDPDVQLFARAYFSLLDSLDTADGRREFRLNLSREHASLLKTELLEVEANDSQRFAAIAARHRVDERAVTKNDGLAEMVRDNNDNFFRVLDPSETGRQDIEDVLSGFNRGRCRRQAGGCILVTDDTRDGGDLPSDKTTTVVLEDVDDQRFPVFDDDGHEATGLNLVDDDTALKLTVEDDNGSQILVKSFSGEEHAYNVLTDLIDDQGLIRREPSDSARITHFVESDGHLYALLEGPDDLNQPTRVREVTSSARIQEIANLDVSELASDTSGLMGPEQDRTFQASDHNYALLDQGGSARQIVQTGRGVVQLELDGGSIADRPRGVFQYDTYSSPVDAVRIEPIYAEIDSPDTSTRFAIRPSGQDGLVGITPEITSAKLQSVAQAVSQIPQGSDAGSFDGQLLVFSGLGTGEAVGVYISPEFHQASGGEYSQSLQKLQTGLQRFFETTDGAELKVRLLASDTTEISRLSEVNLLPDGSSATDLEIPSGMKVLLNLETADNVAALADSLQTFDVDVDIDAGTVGGKLAVITIDPSFNEANDWNIRSQQTSLFRDMVRGGHAVAEVAGNLPGPTLVENRIRADLGMRSISHQVLNLPEVETDTTPGRISFEQDLAGYRINQLGGETGDYTGNSLAFSEGTVRNQPLLDLKIGTDAEGDSVVRIVVGPQSAEALASGDVYLAKEAVVTTLNRFSEFGDMSVPELVSAYNLELDRVFGDRGHSGFRLTEAANSDIHSFSRSAIEVGFENTRTIFSVDYEAIGSPDSGINTLISTGSQTTALAFAAAQYEGSRLAGIVAGTGIEASGNMKSLFTQFIFQEFLREQGFGDGHGSSQLESIFKSGTAEVVTAILSDTDIALLSITGSDQIKLELENAMASVTRSVFGSEAEVGQFSDLRQWADNTFDTAVTLRSNNGDPFQLSGSIGVDLVPNQRTRLAVDALDPTSRSPLTLNGDHGFIELEVRRAANGVSQIADKPPSGTVNGLVRLLQSRVSPLDSPETTRAWVDGILDNGLDILPEHRAFLQQSVSDQITRLQVDNPDAARNIEAVFLARVNDNTPGQLFMARTSRSSLAAPLLKNRLQELVVDLQGGQTPSQATLAKIGELYEYSDTGSFDIETAGGRVTIVLNSDLGLEASYLDNNSHRLVIGTGDQDGWSNGQRSQAVTALVAQISATGDAPGSGLVSLRPSLDGQTILAVSGKIQVSLTLERLWALSDIAANLDQTGDADTAGRLRLTLREALDQLSGIDFDDSRQGKVADLEAGAIEQQIKNIRESTGLPDTDASFDKSSNPDDLYRAIDTIGDKLDGVFDDGDQSITSGYAGAKARLDQIDIETGIDYTPPVIQRLQDSIARYAETRVPAVAPVDLLQSVEYRHFIQNSMLDYLIGHNMDTPDQAVAFMMDGLKISGLLGDDVETDGFKAALFDDPEFRLAIDDVQRSRQQYQPSFDVDYVNSQSSGFVNSLNAKFADFNENNPTAKKIDSTLNGTNARNFKLLFGGLQALAGLGTTSFSATQLARNWDYLNDNQKAEQVAGLVIGYAGSIYGLAMTVNAAAGLVASTFGRNVDQLDGIGLALKSAGKSTKTASLSSRALPIFGNIVGIGFGIYSLQANARALDNAVKHGNKGQEVAYGIQIAFDVLGIILDSISLALDVTGVLIPFGYLFDGLALLASSIQSVISGLIPALNAAQNFFQLVHSDGFKERVLKIVQAFERKGYRTFIHRTDARAQGVDNPYNDDLTELVYETIHLLIGYKGSAVEDSRNVDTNETGTSREDYFRFMGVAKNILNLLDGDDIAYLGAGDDAVLGGDGDDRLYGELDVDHLSGQDGDDYLDDGVNAGVLRGGNGTDTLAPGFGVVLADGGAGHDTLIMPSMHVDYADFDVAALFSAKFGSDIMFSANLTETPDISPLTGAAGGRLKNEFLTKIQNLAPRVTELGRNPMATTTQLFRNVLKLSVLYRESEGRYVQKKVDDQYPYADKDWVKWFGRSLNDEASSEKDWVKLFWRSLIDEAPSEKDRAQYIERYPNTPVAFFIAPVGKVKNDRRSGSVKNMQEFMDAKHVLPYESMETFESVSLLRNTFDARTRDRVVITLNDVTVGVGRRGFPVYDSDKRGKESALPQGAGWYKRDQVNGGGWIGQETRGYTGNDGNNGSFDTPDGRTRCNDLEDASIIYKFILYRSFSIPHRITLLNSKQIYHYYDFCDLVRNDEVWTGNLYLAVAQQQVREVRVDGKLVARRSGDGSQLIFVSSDQRRMITFDLDDINRVAVTGNTVARFYGEFSAFSTRGTLSGIENLEGGNYADRMIGNALANHFRGNWGRNIYEPADGDDVCIGGPDSEFFHMGKGADYVSPGDGTDFIDGGSEETEEANKSVRDTVSYEGLDHGIAIDLNHQTELQPGRAITGEQRSRGPVIRNVEVIRGTHFNDTFIGDDGDNLFDGLSGYDIAEGRGGSDTFALPHGIKNYDGGEGFDWVTGLKKPVYRMTTTLDYQNTQQYTYFTIDSNTRSIRLEKNIGGLYDTPTVYAFSVTLNDETQNRYLIYHQWVEPFIPDNEQEPMPRRAPPISGLTKPTPSAPLRAGSVLPGTYENCMQNFYARARYELALTGGLLGYSHQRLLEVLDITQAQYNEAPRGLNPRKSGHKNVLNRLARDYKDAPACPLQNFHRLPAGTDIYRDVFKSNTKLTWSLNALGLGDANLDDILEALIFNTRVSWRVSPYAAGMGRLRRSDRMPLQTYLVYKTSENQNLDISASSGQFFNIEGIRTGDGDDTIRSNDEYNLILPGFGRDTVYSGRGVTSISMLPGGSRYYKANTIVRQACSHVTVDYTTLSMFDSFELGRRYHYELAELNIVLSGPCIEDRNRYRAVVTEGCTEQIWHFSRVGGTNPQSFEKQWFDSLEGVKGVSLPPVIIRLIGTNGDEVITLNGGTATLNLKRGADTVKLKGEMGTYSILHEGDKPLLLDCSELDVVTESAETGSAKTESSEDGIHVSMSGGAFGLGGVLTSTISAFEHFIDSSKDDRVIGSDKPNFFQIQGGSDVYFGHRGDDFFDFRNIKENYNESPLIEGGADVDTVSFGNLGQGLPGQGLSTPDEGIYTSFEGFNGVRVNLGGAQSTPDSGSDSGSGSPSSCNLYPKGAVRYRISVPDCDRGDACIVITDEKIRLWNIESFIGTEFDDEIYGSPDTKGRLEGRGGNDKLVARFPGTDLFGGAGNDTLVAAWGFDSLGKKVGSRLIGGPDNDRYLGSEGIDTLVADEGEDWIEGNEGTDVYHFLEAAAGSTLVDYSDGNALVLEGDGYDFNSITFTLSENNNYGDVYVTYQEQHLLTLKVDNILHDRRADGSLDTDYFLTRFQQHWSQLKIIDDHTDDDSGGGSGGGTPSCGDNSAETSQRVVPKHPEEIKENRELQGYFRSTFDSNILLDNNWVADGLTRRTLDGGPGNDELARVVPDGLTTTPWMNINGGTGNDILKSVIGPGRLTPGTGSNDILLSDKSRSMIDFGSEFPRYNRIIFKLVKFTELAVEYRPLVAQLPFPLDSSSGSGASALYSGSGSGSGRRAVQVSVEPVNDVTETRFYGDSALIEGKDGDQAWSIQSEGDAIGISNLPIFAHKISLVAWVNVDSESGNGTLFRLGTQRAASEIRLTYDAARQSIGFRIEGHDADSGVSLEADHLVTPGQWCHLAATSDAQGIMTLYKDGLSVASRQGPVIRGIKRHVNYMGNADAGHFKGLFQHVAIVPQALAPEVLENYLTLHRPLYHFVKSGARLDVPLINGLPDVLEFQQDGVVVDGVKNIEAFLKAKAFGEGSAEFQYLINDDSNQYKVFFGAGTHTIQASDIECRSTTIEFEGGITKEHLLLERFEENLVVHVMPRLLTRETIEWWQITDHITIDGYFSGPGPEVLTVDKWPLTQGEVLSALAQFPSIQEWVDKSSLSKMRFIKGEDNLYLAFSSGRSEQFIAQGGFLVLERFFAEDQPADGSGSGHRETPVLTVRLEGLPGHQKALEISEARGINVTALTPASLTLTSEQLIGITAVSAYRVNQTEGYDSLLGGVQYCVLNNRIPEQMDSPYALIGSELAEPITGNVAEGDRFSVDDAILVFAMAGDDRVELNRLTGSFISGGDDRDTLLLTAQPEGLLDVNVPSGEISLNDETIVRFENFEQYIWNTSTPGLLTASLNSQIDIDRGEVTLIAGEGVQNYHLGSHARIQLRLPYQADKQTNITIVTDDLFNQPVNQIERLILPAINNRLNLSGLFKIIKPIDLSGTLNYQLGISHNGETENILTMDAPHWDAVNLRPVQLGEPMTILFWFKDNYRKQYSIQRTLWKAWKMNSESAGQFEYRMTLTLRNKGLIFEILRWQVGWNNRSSRLIEASNCFEQSQWQHFAVVVEKQRTSIYLNGELLLDKMHTTAREQSVYLKYDTYANHQIYPVRASGDAVDGKLGFSIHKLSFISVALTPEEIQQLYSSPASVLAELTLSPSYRVLILNSLPRQVEMADGSVFYLTDEAGSDKNLLTHLFESSNTDFHADLNQLRHHPLYLSGGDNPSRLILTSNGIPFTEIDLAAGYIRQEGELIAGLSGIERMEWYGGPNDRIHYTGLATGDHFKAVRGSVRLTGQGGMDQTYLLGEARATYELQAGYTSGKNLIILESAGGQPGPQLVTLTLPGIRDRISHQLYRTVALGEGQRGSYTVLGGLERPLEGRKQGIASTYRMGFNQFPNVRYPAFPLGGTITVAFWIRKRSLFNEALLWQMKGENNSSSFSVRLDYRHLHTRVELNQSPDGGNVRSIKSKTDLIGYHPAPTEAEQWMHVAVVSKPGALTVYTDAAPIMSNFFVNGADKYRVTAEDYPLLPVQNRPEQHFMPVIPSQEGQHDSLDLDDFIVLDEALDVFELKRLMAVQSGILSQLQLDSPDYRFLIFDGVPGDVVINRLGYNLFEAAGSGDYPDSSHYLPPEELPAPEHMERVTARPESGSGSGSGFAGIEPRIDGAYCQIFLTVSDDGDDDAGNNRPALKRCTHTLIELTHTSAEQIIYERNETDLHIHVIPVGFSRDTVKWSDINFRMLVKGYYGRTPPTVIRIGDQLLFDHAVAENIVARDWLVNEYVDHTRFLYDGPDLKIVTRNPRYWPTDNPDRLKAYDYQLDTLTSPDYFNSTSPGHFTLLARPYNISYTAIDHLRQTSLNETIFDDRLSDLSDARGDLVNNGLGEELLFEFYDIAALAYWTQSRWHDYAVAVRLKNCLDYIPESALDHHNSLSNRNLNLLGMEGRLLPDGSGFNTDGAYVISGTPGNDVFHLRYELGLAGRGGNDVFVMDELAGSHIMGGAGNNTLRFIRAHRDTLRVDLAKGEIKYRKQLLATCSGINNIQWKSKANALLIGQSEDNNRFEVTDGTVTVVTNGGEDYVHLSNRAAVTIEQDTRSSGSVDIRLESRDNLPARNGLLKTLSFPHAARRHSQGVIIKPLDYELSNGVTPVAGHNGKGRAANKVYVDTDSPRFPVDLPRIDFKLPLTIAFWLKTTNVQSDNHLWEARNQDGTRLMRVYLGVINAFPGFRKARHLRFLVSNTGASNQTQEWEARGFIPPGRYGHGTRRLNEVDWIHAAISMDREGGVTFYRNGKKFSSICIKRKKYNNFHIPSITTKETDCLKVLPDSGPRDIHQLIRSFEIGGYNRRTKPLEVAIEHLTVLNHQASENLLKDMMLADSGNVAYIDVGDEKTSIRLLNGIPQRLEFGRETIDSVNFFNHTTPALSVVEPVTPEPATVMPTEVTVESPTDDSGFIPSDNVYLTSASGHRVLPVSGNEQINVEIGEDVSDRVLFAQNGNHLWLLLLTQASDINNGAANLRRVVSSLILEGYFGDPVPARTVNLADVELTREEVIDRAADSADSVHWLSLQRFEDVRFFREGNDLLCFIRKTNVLRGTLGDQYQRMIPGYFVGEETLITLSDDRISLTPSELSGICHTVRKKWSGLLGSTVRTLNQMNAARAFELTSGVAWHPLLRRHSSANYFNVGDMDSNYLLYERGVVLGQDGEDILKIQTIDESGFISGGPDTDTLYMEAESTEENPVSVDLGTGTVSQLALNVLIDSIEQFNWNSNGPGSIFGSDEDDNIQLSTGSVTVRGRGGDDQIVESSGTDTRYEFGRGDGRDRITDSGGMNTLAFDEGIGLENIECHQLESGIEIVYFNEAPSSGSGSGESSGSGPRGGTSSARSSVVLPGGLETIDHLEFAAGASSGGIVPTTELECLIQAMSSMPTMSGTDASVYPQYMPPTTVTLAPSGG